MSEKTSIEGGEPSDLLGYINSQEFLTEEVDSSAVNAEDTESLNKPDQGGVTQSESQGASPEAEQQGVTTPSAATDDEKTQLQQQLDAERQSSAKMRQALTMFAVEARKREDALFEQKIELLTPEEQETEREKRRVSQIELDNQYLRSQFDAQQRRQTEAQEQIDKTTVAHNLIARLELPGTDPVIMQTLMESQDFPEMVAKAQRIAQVYKITAEFQRKAQAQTANASGVHNAGGEVAPASPPPAVPQRQGNLLGMMRERQYSLE